MSLLLLLSLTFAAAVVQASVPLPWWPLDLPLLVVAFAGLSLGGGRGLACGLLGGFTLAALLGDPVGLRMVPLAVTGALADALAPSVNRDQPRLQVAVVLALTAVHDAVLALFARRYQIPQYGLERMIFAYALPRLAAQALGALPLFLALGFLVRRKAFLGPHQGRVKRILRWP